MKRRLLTNALRMHVTRRGAVFHYYMMYLFLSGMLLTTSGLCIHSILKANQGDVEIAAYLNTLRRLEGDLRNDAQSDVSVEVQDAGITLTGSKDTAVVRWSIKDNVARRETLKGQQTITSNRYVFIRGTELNFTWQNQQLVLHIQEAPLMPASKDAPASDTPTAATKSVSIVTVIAADDGGES